MTSRFQHSSPSSVSFLHANGNEVVLATHSAERGILGLAHSLACFEDSLKQLSHNEGFDTPQTKDWQQQVENLDSNIRTIYAMLRVVDGDYKDLFHIVRKQFKLINREQAKQKTKQNHKNSFFVQAIERAPQPIKDTLLAYLTVADFARLRKTCRSMRDLRNYGVAVGMMSVRSGRRCVLGSMPTTESQNEKNSYVMFNKAKTTYGINFLARKKDAADTNTVAWCARTVCLAKKKSNVASGTHMSYWTSKEVLQTLLNFPNSPAGWKVLREVERQGVSVESTHANALEEMWQVQSRTISLCDDHAGEMQVPPSAIVRWSDESDSNAVVMTYVINHKESTQATTTDFHEIITRKEVTFPMKFLGVRGATSDNIWLAASNRPNSLVGKLQVLCQQKNSDSVTAIGCGFSAMSPWVLVKFWDPKTQTTIKVPAPTMFNDEQIAFDKQARAYIGPKGANWTSRTLRTPKTFLSRPEIQMYTQNNEHVFRILSPGSRVCKFAEITLWKNNKQFAKGCLDFRTLNCARQVDSDDESDATSSPQPRNTKFLYLEPTLKPVNVQDIIDNTVWDCPTCTVTGHIRANLDLPSDATSLTISYDIGILDASESDIRGVYAFFNDAEQAQHLDAATENYAYNTIPRTDIDECLGFMNPTEWFANPDTIREQMRGLTSMRWTPKQVDDRVSTFSSLYDLFKEVLNDEQTEDNDMLNLNVQTGVQYYMFNSGTIKRNYVSYEDLRKHANKPPDSAITGQMFVDYINNKLYAFNCKGSIASLQSMFCNNGNVISKNESYNSYCTSGSPLKSLQQRLDQGFDFMHSKNLGSLKLLLGSLNNSLGETWRSGDQEYNREMDRVITMAVNLITSTLNADFCSNHVIVNISPFKAVKVEVCKIELPRRMENLKHQKLRECEVGAMQDMQAVIKGNCEFYKLDSCGGLSLNVARQIDDMCVNYAITRETSSRGTLGISRTGTVLNDASVRQGNPCLIYNYSDPLMTKLRPGVYCALPPGVHHTMRVAYEACSEFYGEDDESDLTTIRVN